MKKTGILLINLGTPKSSSPKSLRRFLKEFLSDPCVVDIPALARWVLVDLIILPFRTRKSASAYQKIWQEAGSPLLINSVQMKEALAQKLPDYYQVELGMRYGEPNIESAVLALKNCETMVVLPLFPQYSNAATGSALAVVKKILSEQGNTVKVYIQQDFYNHTGFIKAMVANIRKGLIGKSVEKIVLSYHGLPERHLSKTSDALPCYRTQCFKTSQLIAQALDLMPGEYEVAFQSRLGRTPWIKPYTDRVLPDLIERGIHNIAVVCPSFVADCLETLEEINIRARAQWRNLGGKEFIFIPCLNSNPVWIKALEEMVQSKLD